MEMKNSELSETDFKFLVAFQVWYDDHHDMRHINDPEVLRDELDDGELDKFLLKVCEVVPPDSDRDDSFTPVPPSSSGRRPSVKRRMTPRVTWIA